VHYEWSPIVLSELPSDALAQAPEFVPRDADVDTFVCASALRPGDRAPEAPGLVVLNGPPTPGSAAALSLFDLFEPARHTALVFVPAAAQPAALRKMLNVLRAVPAALMRVVLVLLTPRDDLADTTSNELAVLDQNGHAFHVYQPDRYGFFTSVLVRPDAMVGAIVHSGKGVTDYLRKVLAEGIF
jgi:hypothetical protein